MSAKKAKKTDEYFVKALNPKDQDTKYLGEESYFALQPVEVERRIALARCFAWYNKFYGKKDAKELLAQYCEHHNRPQDAKILRKVDEKEFLMTLCWLSRMNMRGLELSEHEELTIENEITRLLQVVHKPHVTEENKEEPITNNRPNVQEIMREKAREAGGELEALFDDFITTNKASGKVVDIVAKYNVLPQHIPLIVEAWKRKQEEFNALVKGDDKDLNEGYAFLGKVQVRNIVKYIEQVLGDLNSYISIKKASKAPRKKKAVPIEKVVAKLKYLKEFKDPANKLDLVSMHPTKLHGASEAWIYDTNRRKLHHYIADEYSKSFTVKGNTLIGFDANKSEIKTLRKPNEQIKEIMGSKPAARKYFENIKAVAAKSNGRFNANMIILKAF